MPIRQHPLLRFYAEAAQKVPMFSLINPAPRKEVMEQFGRAVAELPHVEWGWDSRHDEIREVLVEVALGGHPEKGTFQAQARRASGRLHEHLLNLATMGGTRIPAQIAPGSILHFFSDGFTDIQTFGRGHRRILEVTDFNFSFVVLDGQMTGMTGTYLGTEDPEALTPFLQPSSECGQECHRGGQ